MWNLFSAPTLYQEPDGSYSKVHKNDALWTVEFFALLLSVVVVLAGAKMGKPQTMIVGGILFGICIISFFAAFKLGAAATLNVRTAKFFWGTSIQFLWECPYFHIPGITKVTEMSCDLVPVETPYTTAAGKAVTSEVMFLQSDNTIGVTFLLFEIVAKVRLNKSTPRTVVDAFEKDFRISHGDGINAVKEQAALLLSTSSPGFLQQYLLQDYVSHLAWLNAYLPDYLSPLFAPTGLELVSVEIRNKKTVDGPGPLEELMRASEAKAKSDADIMVALSDLAGRTEEIKTAREKSLLELQAATDVANERLLTLQAEQAVEAQTAINALQAVMAQMRLFSGKKKWVPLLLAKLEALPQDKQVELGTAIAAALKSDVHTQVAVGDGTALADSIPMAAIIKWLKEVVS